MLSGDYTGMQTAMALGAIFGLLWLLAVSLFGFGVTGLALHWSPLRVRFSLRAALTIAALLSPFFGYFGYSIYREAFVEYELHHGHNFWMIVCGLGMPTILFIIILSAIPLLRTAADRIAAYHPAHP